MLVLLSSLEAFSQSDHTHVVQQRLVQRLLAYGVLAFL
jgi:hypothetical protein